MNVRYWTVATVLPSSHHDANAPFECVIVCELTGQTRALFEKSLAQNSTPDGEGYYGWSNRHRAHIRVISFQKMLRDAENRNKAFFDQLTLGSPSLAAKKRQAKVRQRRGAAYAGGLGNGATDPNV